LYPFEPFAKVFCTVKVFDDSLEDLTPESEDSPLSGAIFKEAMDLLGYSTDEEKKGRHCMTLGGLPLRMLFF